MKRKPKPAIGDVRVMPAEIGHPTPSLGARLQIYVELFDTKHKIPRKWVTVALGHPRTLQQVVDYQKKAAEEAVAVAKKAQQKLLPNSLS